MESIKILKNGLKVKLIANNRDNSTPNYLRTMKMTIRISRLVRVELRRIH